MRKIDYLFSGEEFVQLSEDTNYQESLTALGYLSTWNMSIPFVEIYINIRHSEITATYRKLDSTLAYQIGAIWRDDDKAFSFHS